MAILDIVKKALLIPLSESFADEELNTHINSCKAYLASCGIDPAFISDESNPMISTIIIIYVKTFFGFKNDGSAKELPKTFDMLVGQVALTKGAN
ncbi:hypothetical protein HF295_04585 [Hujiaoplasma nucleasis]|uniref:Phage gp6-like head-tail connector protein n=1 Tax=Hujiaoplasma nucleasis TaxID=2725268 RepID=A0A7L6N4H2_9MOLU|nr:hypothetical protein [Hujiaoplasma nucleasis]QLY40177.1 hypothetical protein HF295_04585 [Hujiaoplasma nucleasis]